MFRNVSLKILIKYYFVTIESKILCLRFTWLHICCLKYCLFYENDKAIFRLFLFIYPKRFHLLKKSNQTLTLFDQTLTLFDQTLTLFDQILTLFD